MDVSPLSTAEDIKRKYKKAVKRHHPDVSEDDGKISEINRAYEILNDYVKNYKFTFSVEEIQRQYPEEFLKKFKV